MQKIEKVVLYEYPVSVEYKGTYTSGWKDEVLTNFIVETRAGGVSGFGECVPCNVRFIPGQSAEMNYDEREALLEMCDALVGQDPLKMGHLISDCIRRHDTNNIVDAVDFALHDLVGKLHNISVLALLGGAYKPFVWGMPVIYTANPEVMSDKAREWYQKYGFRYYKLKPNGNAEADEETLRKIREKTSPDVRVFEDPNLSLRMTPDEVVAYLNHLADFGLGMCEDPLDADLETYAYIRSRSRVPVMIDFRSRTEEAVFNIVSAKAADAINIHANQAGGFQPAIRRSQLAAVGGVQTMIGSTHYAGIGSAAYQLLSSILPGDMPCEQVYVEVYGGESLVENPFEIRDGMISIPDRPGLGVKVDMKRLTAESTSVHEIG